MENKEKGCTCTSTGKLVLACSGAADLGYISDQVARMLSRHNIRKMNCLAVAASGTKEQIDLFRNSDLLVIDGCNEDCGRKIMEEKMITQYKYLRLTDMGYEKGKTEPSSMTIKEIFKKAERI